MPAGFAHGYCVLSASALFHYKCTTNYDPDSEHAIRYDDADIGIDWPLGGEPPRVSDKDRAASRISETPSLILF